jgi:hypothetical protein
MEDWELRETEFLALEIRWKNSINWAEWVRCARVTSEPGAVRIDWGPHRNDGALTTWVVLGHPICQVVETRYVRKED